MAVSRICALVHRIFLGITLRVKTLNRFFRLALWSGLQFSVTGQAFPGLNSSLKNCCRYFANSVARITQIHSVL